MPSEVRAKGKEERLGPILDVRPRKATVRPMSPRKSKIQISLAPPKASKNKPKGKFGNDDAKEGRQG